MPRSPFLPVKPALPVAPYFGGKRLLAKRIAERIGAIDHTLYAEPFVGMGGVFFRRDKRPKTEVVNDLSRDIANLFRILQRHYPQFMDVLQWQLTTRADFDRLIATNPGSLTDLERAARFLYLQRTAYGGKISGRHFGVQRFYPARFDARKLTPLLERAKTRLSGVVIECLSWAEFIERYDRPGALFYLDPPYYGCEAEYGPQFDRGQLLSMPDVLGRLRGRWIMSINDRPDIRRAFAGFNIQEAMVRYTVAGANKRRDFLELIVSN